MWMTWPSLWLNRALGAAKLKLSLPRVFGLPMMIMIIMVFVNDDHDYNADDYGNDDNDQEKRFVIQVCCSWQRDKLLQLEKSDRRCRVREGNLYKDYQTIPPFPPNDLPMTLLRMKSHPKKNNATLPSKYKVKRYLQVKQWQRIFRGDFQQEMHSIRREGLLPILDYFLCIDIKNIPI